MLVMRMSRHGTKKRPFYHIVVADSRYPRDGRFIEKVGTYNPMLKNDNPQRVTLVEDKIKQWIKNGAQPSERVARFLHKAGIGPKVEWRETPQKSAPRAKAQERMKMEAAAAEEAKKAAEAAAAAPPPKEEAVPASAESPAEAPAEGTPA